ncbi:MAG TPA: Fic family protein [Flavitalea sp.]|nr:Fic family protein [Flavitalea sp.]
MFYSKVDWGADTPLLHLEFALKYDDLSLDFLKAVLERISPEEIKAFVQKAPSSKYARKIGFLYEFLTTNTIELARPVTANYTDLLEQEEYITGQVIKNNKWKINNNLLGNQEFCPVVRKTNALVTLLETDIHQKIEQLKESFPQDIFNRATNYLYNKETRSSYEIEKEKPSPDRMEKFIALLVKAGSEATEKMMEKQRLIQLQNAIVDPRFAAADFRDFQSFVGESLPNYQDLIHYICPPPATLSSLMNGLKEVAGKSNGIYPQVRASVIAFGFVFIHPFEDGNGRLHRFLIHDILVHDGIVPPGLIIPVSAHMLNNIKDYDSILEKYSKPLMQRIRYDKKDNGAVTVTNPEEVEGYFRYPDLTEHCIYLIQTIHATLEEDMPDEVIFFQRYDEAKKELQRIVDMPDKDINLMIIFLHQNNGVFPKRRREQFSKLTDEEIQQMQQAYRTVYEMDAL